MSVQEQPNTASNFDYVLITQPQQQQQQQQQQPQLQLQQHQQQQQQIELNLRNLKKDVGKIDIVIKDYCDGKERFVLQQQNAQSIDYAIQNVAASSPRRDQELQRLTQIKNESERVLRHNANYFFARRGLILNLLCDIENVVKIVGTEIKNELLGWQMMLQKSLSGGPKPDSLDDIQQWINIFVDVVHDFYALASKFKRSFDDPSMTKSPGDRERIELLLTAIINDLQSLIQFSFVVDKQPPQVLKTQTKFQTSVRLLVGSNRSLGMEYPEVEVSILSERQCLDMVQRNSLEGIGNCGEILNGRCRMEQNRERTVLQAEFKNLQLKKIQRPDRREQESVLEAKSALVFSAKINIWGDLFSIMVKSVPVVVVVHGNQCPDSEATIIWDNMFSHPLREPFVVPEAVSWQEMSVALNARWMMVNEKELSFDHLMFLKKKLFSNIELHIQGQEPLIPWAAFNKEPLTDQVFTFWQWFHGSVDATKKDLKDHWKSNYIEFMSKEDAHVKLLERPAGTFLIRFSDSQVGAVTIAWCTQRNGPKEVLLLEPWSSKHLSVRSLTDRIFDLPELTHLYPDTPKEHAFSRTIPLETQGSLYVSTDLVTCIRSTSPHNVSVTGANSTMDFALDLDMDLFQGNVDIGNYDAFPSLSLLDLDDGAPLEFPMTQ